MKLFVGQILLLVTLLIFVIIMKHVGSYPEYVLPSITTISEYFEFHLSFLLKAGLWTFAFSSLGLAIAVLGAGLSARLVGGSKALAEFALAMGAAWQTYPIVAIAPLLFVLFSDGWITRLIIVATMAYFPCFITFLAIGSSRIASLESYFEQIVSFPKGGPLLLRFNHSGRVIENSIIGSGATALVGAIVAEFLVADNGLGALIRLGQYNHHTEQIIGSLVCIALLSSIFFPLLRTIVRLVVRGAKRESSHY